MNQLIRQMRNVKYRQESIRDDLIDGFMPGDAMVRIVAGELIEDLSVGCGLLRLQKRTGGAG